MTESFLTKFFGGRRRGLVVTDPAGNPTVKPFGAAGTFLRDDGTFATPAGTGAPVGAQYVALATDATLTNERVLTGTSNQIILADSGAGAAITLSTPQNLHTSATPQFARVGLGAAADSSAVIKAVGQAFSPLVADGNSGTAKTIDWDAGNEHLLTLTGNVTLTLSNPKDGGRYVLVFDTGAGAFTVAWPGTVKWAAGTTPTITVTAAKYDLVTLIWLNTAGIYLAVISQNHG